VLGTFGALGVLPFVDRYRPVLVLAVIGCVALAIHSVVRRWRVAARSSARTDTRSGSAPCARGGSRFSLGTYLRRGSLVARA